MISLNNIPLTSDWICSVCEYHKKNCSSSPNRWNCKRCHIFNRVKSQSCGLCISVISDNKKSTRSVPSNNDSIAEQKDCNEFKWISQHGTLYKQLRNEWKIGSKCIMFSGAFKQWIYTNIEEIENKNG
eukprot:86369_1